MDFHFFVRLLQWATVVLLLTVIAHQLQTNMMLLRVIEADLEINNLYNRLEQQQRGPANGNHRQRFNPDGRQHYRI